LFRPELPPVETAVMRALVGSEGSTGSLPGDYLSIHIAELQAQGAAVDPAKIAALRAQYGLDQPFFVQYLTLLGNLI